MLKILKDESPPQPWYAKGLRFKCTECGKCCTGAPGYVWVTEKEIKKIADYLQLPIDKFTRVYLRRVKDRFSLAEKRRPYDCIFLKDNKCQIYPVRPTQCRTFPWWPQNLKSEEAWKEAAQSCEGINHPEASVVPLEIIEQQLAIHQEKV